MTWDTGKLTLIKQHGIHAEKLLNLQKEKKAKKLDDNSNKGQLILLQMVSNQAYAPVERGRGGRGGCGLGRGWTDGCFICFVAKPITGRETAHRRGNSETTIFLGESDELVSHFASCACLSDRRKHPSFFRTVPSDYFQSRALAKLVKYFGWTWVGALCSDNDYGNNGISEFISAAKEEGICIEYSMAFFKTDPREKILKIVDLIKASTSKVIVAFVAYSDFGFLLKEMALQNMTGFQWIGSESWISDLNTANAEWQYILKGSLGFAIPKAKINGLGEFLIKLNPASDIAIYKELWETIFQCKFQTQEAVEMKQLCKGNESLTQVQSIYTDVSDLRIANNVYKAVYSVAYALHNSYECSKRDSGQAAANVCTNLADNQKPWQIVNELKKIHFTTTTDEDVFFDENGDPAARYDVLNWQQDKDSKIVFVKVGFYDASLHRDIQLSFNNISIVWAHNKLQ
ncbi:extracellular calcium-sensing receptor-like, partial [Clarias magur]